MAKLPYMQFYQGDWLSDPAVRMLSPAARGIWFDFLCHMANDRSGVIAGNRVQLSRLASCSTDEVSGAMNEWELCGTADVADDGNGIVTVTNRRMKKESDERKNAALRQARHREVATDNGPVTDESHPILQSTEDRVQKGSDKVSKPFQGGGSGGRGLTKGQAEVAVFCESVLNGQWVNDGGKWVERIKVNPEKVMRVMSDVKNAAAEKRVKTTPAQMAEHLWGVFK